MIYKFICSLFTIICLISCSKHDKNEVKTYYPDGEVQSLTIYDKKKDLTKITEFDSLGNKTREYHKRNNLAQGVFKLFFPNGKLGLKVSYNNGMKVGKEETFYKNGQVHKLAHYNNGFLDGDFFIYNRKGKLLDYAVYESSYYEPNITIYHEQYDSNGIFKKIEIRPIVEGILDTLELNQIDSIHMMIYEKADSNFNYYLGFELKQYNGEDISSSPLIIRADRSNLESINPDEQKILPIAFTKKGKILFSVSCLIGNDSIPIEDWQLSMDYHKVIIIK